MKTGADALVAASVAAGIDTCFANPGTTEMAIVQALTANPALRSVLVLFEGVASGAADGYARLAGKPAATLLHLGPGLGNATANLHNARRARSPVVNWVGDHTTWLRPHDPPLTSDIESIARGTSRWIHTSARLGRLADDAVQAVRAAYGPPAGVATLILPADLQDASIDAGFSLPQDAKVTRPARLPESDALEAAAKALREAAQPLLLLGGSATSAAGLQAAKRVAAAVGARLLLEQFPARVRHAPGLPHVGRLGYLPPMARPQLEGHDLVALVGTEEPVCFFGYPGERPSLVPETARLVDVTGPHADAASALQALADLLGAPAFAPEADTPAPAPAPQGTLAGDSLAAAVAHTLPEEAIVLDEGITTSTPFYAALASAPAHDYLAFKGGSIGASPAAAVGAATAAPDRPVLCFVGDGSAMYTLQALWTQAREGLNVTTLVAVNDRYSILRLELMRSGGQLEGAGASLTELSPPSLDFVALAKGMGVPGREVGDAEALAAALRESFATPGPMLIAARVPSI